MTEKVCFLSCCSRGFFFNFRRPILVTLISVMIVASVLTGVLLQSKPKNSSSPPPPGNEPCFSCRSLLSQISSDHHLLHFYFLTAVVGVPTKVDNEPVAAPVKIGGDAPKVENQADKVDPGSKPKVIDPKKTDEGAVASGTYRNLFIELLGKSEADVKAKLDAGFSHLFHGDSLTETIFYEVKGIILG